MRVGIFSRVSRSIIPAMCTFLLTLAFAQSASAQTDPLIGTWRLNVARSTYNPGPPPRSGTATVHPAGQGAHVIIDEVSAAGMPIRMEFPVTYDGQPQPESGAPNIDAVAHRRLNPRTVEFTATQSGRMVSSGTLAFSEDGRTLTVTMRGTNANGQQFQNVTVNEKQ